MSIKMHYDGLSRPLDNPKLRVLSLGAGVQSTTLALMAARGEIGPMPDCAIFADTRAEKASVYAHLDWLETVLPFPVIRVSRAGLSLGDLMLAVASGERSEKGASIIPYFVGSGGMIPKQCSKEFKTRVVSKEVRRQLGIGDGKRGPKEPIVEMWLGISQDEMQRMKFNEKKWIHNRWPLIEARMNRRACIQWMEERQYPKAPRSACWFCPFLSKAERRDMRDNEPEDHAKAVTFDLAVRSAHPDGAYLVRDCVPLGEANLDAPEEYGFGFDNECEGMCGV